MLDVLVVASRRDGEIATSALRNLGARMRFRGRTFLIMEDRASARAAIERVATPDVGEMADHELLSSSELLLDPWYRQQLIKLRAGRVLAGSSYVVLSGDALLLRRIRRDELVDPASDRPYLYVTRYRYPARHLAYERSRVMAVGQLLGVEPRRARLLGDFIADLFCFERATLEATLGRLRDRWGASWPRMFEGKVADARHKREFGEYTLYAVGALDCGLDPPPVRWHWQTHILQIHGPEALERAEFDAAVLHVVDKNLPVSKVAGQAARHGVKLLVSGR